MCIRDSHLAAWGNGAVATASRASRDLFEGAPLDAATRAVVCESTEQADEFRALAATHEMKCKVALLVLADRASADPPWGEQRHFAARLGDGSLG
eukprot:3529784-Alexandrium_andersonii.AAC.1